MKSLYIVVILLLTLASCDYKYDVVIEQTDGTTKKFECKNDKDTLNSTVFRFYEWILVSKWNYVDGKKEGSLINYHPDGTIKIITNYINDTVHGVNKVFNDSGTLVRRSFYIKNNQVLFESEMISEDFPGVYRKKIVHKNKNKELIWAGVLYLDQNNKPTNVGSVKTKTDSLEYKGMYVDIAIEDTLNLLKEYSIGLNITLPATEYHSEILIGEFDINLKCVDTIYYAKPDSIVDKHTFRFQPVKSGNNYLIGRLNNLEIVKDDIYFYKDFYVKPN